MQICMQLATIQKKDLSIANYYRRVKRLSDTLAAIGKRLEDEELISYLLCGLDLDYDPLITSITTCADTITLSDVYAYMLSFKDEARKQQQQQQQQFYFSWSGTIS
jgi:hypothetical protein